MIFISTYINYKIEQYSNMNSLNITLNTHRTFRRYKSELFYERIYTFTYLDFSSLACAFICWTSIESGLRLLINRSWLPIHKSRILTNNTWAAVPLVCSFNFKAIKPLTQLPTSDCFFTSLFMRVFCEKNMKFGDVFSTGLIMNFLSSKLIWRISDHVNVVFGASLFSFS